MSNVLIFGAGNQARYAIDTLEAGGEHKIVGLLDPFRAAGTSILGYKVLGGYSDMPRVLKDCKVDSGFIAIGENWIRCKVAEEAGEIEPTLPFVSAIHPTAIISGRAKVGAGTLILPGAVVASEAQVGKFCFLGTSATLEHGSTMEDYAFLSSGAITGGLVLVRECATIALGATVRDRVTIGAHALVGAGALVMHDVPSNVVAYGRPARVIRSRGESEPIFT